MYLAPRATAPPACRLGVATGMARYMRRNKQHNAPTFCAQNLATA